MRSGIDWAIRVAVYAPALGLFYLDPLRIHDQVVRSLLAALVGCGLQAAADRLRGPYREDEVGQLVFWVSFFVIYFGDPLGVANPFSLALLACVIGLVMSCAAALVVAVWRSRQASCALLLAATMSATAALAQPCSTSPPDPDAAWSAGFASFVGRFCHGWRTDTEAFFRAHALPGPEPACFGTQFAPGLPTELAYRAGAQAAEAANRADPLFCVDPARPPPARPLVRDFIAQAVARLPQRLVYAGDVRRRTPPRRTCAGAR